MTDAPTRFPPIYLAELLNPKTGEVEEADVFSKLELAVERVKRHLDELEVVPTDIDASCDEDDELEGIAFLNCDGELMACVAVYHLERETAVAADESIALACRGAHAELQAKLTHIFCI